MLRCTRVAAVAVEQKYEMSVGEQPSAKRAAKGSTLPTMSTYAELLVRRLQRLQMSCS
jgi:hypothetical protein